MQKTSKIYLGALLFVLLSFFTSCTLFNKPTIVAIAPQGLQELLTPVSDDGGKLGIKAVTNKNISDFIKGKINTDFLKPANTANTTLSLNLPDKIATLERHMSKIRNENNNYTWIGKVKNNESSNVVLTVVDGIMCGTIDIDEKNQYNIQSVPGAPSEYTIVKKDPTKIKVDGLKNDQIIPDIKQINKLHTMATSGSEDGSVIDIMVLYTPTMQANYPGAAIKALVQNFVDLTNVSFTNSGINTQLRLTYSGVCNSSNIQEGTDISSALPNFQSDPAVKNLRDSNKADLVALLRVYSGANYCGMGYVLTSPAPDWAFTVTEVGSSGGYYCENISFPHELGHNLGCSHDRAHASNPGIYPYSYGYDLNNGSVKFADIMSYNYPHINYFSTPLKMYNGYPIGVDAASPNSADNARTINQTRVTTANYRTNTITPPPTVVLPVITTLNPASGYANTNVIITGNNFGTSAGTVKFGTTAAVVKSWANTSITLTAPALTGTVSVTVTNSSGTSNGVNFTYIVSKPVINSINPTSGVPGNFVTITGNNFGTVPGSVKFGSTNATLLSWGNTSITLTAPPLSGSVTVNVTTTAGTSNNLVFTYIKPVLNSLTPNTGYANSNVTITGNNFGTFPGSVKFGSTNATLLSWGNTTITVTAPALSGRVSVTVTNSSGTTNGVNFTYIVSKPIINSITPASGVPGTFMTITGNNFGTSGGTVKFGNNPVVSKSWTNTSITVPIPALTGTLSVTVTNSSGISNGVNFTYIVNKPVITTINPNTGNNTAVTITGNNFGTSGGTVKFGDNPVVSKSWTNTSITVTAPSAGGTVLVTVTNSAGTSNGVNFTYSKPVINSLTPNTGYANSTVTITGNYFGTVVGSVKFGSTNVTILSWNSINNSIIVTAPALTGTVLVTVTNSAGTSNGVNFTYNVSSNSPKINYILGVAATSMGGDHIKIKGTNFGKNRGWVMIGNASGNIEEWDDTSITVRGPKGYAGYLRVFNSSVKQDITTISNPYAYYIKFTK